MLIDATVISHIIQWTPLGLVASKLNKILRNIKCLFVFLCVFFKTNINISSFYVNYFTPFYYLNVCMLQIITSYGTI